MKKEERFIFDDKTLTYKPVIESRKRRILKLMIPFILIPAITIYSINYLIPDKTSSIESRLLLLQQERYIEKLESLSNITDSLELDLQEMKRRDDHLYSTVVERDPLPTSVRDAGFGGSDIGMNYHAITKEVYKKTGSLLSRAQVQQNSFKEIYDLLKQKNNYWEHMPVIPPVATKDLERFGDGFGRRFHPILKYFRPHEGIDLICDRGKPIFSPAKGVVIETRYSLSFGNVVKIKHTNKITTLYAHLSKFKVNEGDIISRGDTIGLAGSTGLSSGSHLHYEIHRNGIPVNPKQYIHSSFTQEEYDQILSLNK